VQWSQQSAKVLVEMTQSVWQGIAATVDPSTHS
jgi:hypothetical protein